MRELVGTVQMTYSEDGEILTKTFRPKMAIEEGDAVECLEGLSGLKAEDDKTLKDNAENVFAAWYAKINKIEQADQLAGAGLRAETVHCEKYPSGKVKKVIFDFIHIS